MTRSPVPENLLDEPWVRRRAPSSTSRATGPDLQRLAHRLAELEDLWCAHLAFELELTNLGDSSGSSSFHRRFPALSNSIRHLNAGSIQLLEDIHDSIESCCEADRARLEDIRERTLRLVRTICGRETSTSP